jgi:hypothetical protein
MAISSLTHCPALRSLLTSSLYSSSFHTTSVTSLSSLFQSPSVRFDNSRKYTTRPTPQTKEEVAKLHQTDYAELSNDQILNLCEKGFIPSYKLEATLGDLERAVVIRRQLISRR